MMRRIICIMLIICLLSVPTQALNLVKADYDKDKWEVETITFDLPDTVPESWYPLKAVSEYLPIDVSWDEEKREIVVVSHDMRWKNKMLFTFRYKADNLPIEMKIQDGVTYCNGRLLASYLCQRGFLYQGEVYFLDGESHKSKLIKPGDYGAAVKEKTLATMYEIKMKIPEEYKFIRKYLSGGITYVTPEQSAASNKMAMGYVYSARKTPICYIVGDSHYNGLLAQIIAHEAYHVYEYRTYGYTNEIEPTKHGRKIKNLLDEIK